MKGKIEFIRILVLVYNLIYLYCNKYNLFELDYLINGSDTILYLSKFGELKHETSSIIPVIS